MANPVPLNKMSVLAVGEVLWDMIGPDKHLGGAPFNFAYHCRAQGAISRILSRVGDDELGAMIFKQAQTLDVSTALLQVENPETGGGNGSQDG